MGSDSVGQTHWVGISSHKALWSLGMALLNAKYPAWQWSISVTGTKMPSIGKLHWLCIAGGVWWCSAMVISMRPTDLGHVRIFGS